jgi:hypothetical protein
MEQSQNASWWLRTSNHWDDVRGYAARTLPGVTSTLGAAGACDPGLFWVNLSPRRSPSNVRVALDSGHWTDMLARPGSARSSHTARRPTGRKRTLAITDVSGRPGSARWRLIAPTIATLHSSREPNVVRSRTIQNTAEFSCHLAGLGQCWGIPAWQANRLQAR